MTGIQFVTDEKGHKIAVQIDLKKHGAILEDFWDGLIGESRRKEKGIPLRKGQSRPDQTGAAAWVSTRLRSSFLHEKSSTHCRISCLLG